MSDEASDGAAEAAEGATAGADAQPADAGTDTSTESKGTMFDSLKGEAPPGGEAGDDTATGSEGSTDWKGAFEAAGIPADKLKQFDTPDKFYKAFTDSQTAARAKTEGMLKPPDDETSEAEKEAWDAAVAKARGVPESVDGYDITPPEGVPEEMWDGELAKGFAEKAHSLGLGKGEARELLDWYNEGMAAQATANQQAAQADAAKVREAWGKEFDRNLQQSMDVATALGLPTDRQPTAGELAVAFQKMAGTLLEDSPGRLQADVSAGQNPYDEAQAIISGDHPLSAAYKGQKGYPAQQSASAKVDALLAKARDMGLLEKV